MASSNGIQSTSEGKCPHHIWLSKPLSALHRQHMILLVKNASIEPKISKHVQGFTIFQWKVSFESKAWTGGSLQSFRLQQISCQRVHVQKLGKRFQDYVYLWNRSWRHLTWSQPPSWIFACTLSSRAWLDSSWHGDGTSTTQVAAARHKPQDQWNIHMRGTKRNYPGGSHLYANSALGEIWSRNSAQKLKKDCSWIRRRICRGV
jgi:hypothetical protein